MIDRTPDAARSPGFVAFCPLDPYAINFPVYLLQSRQVRTRCARLVHEDAPALCNAKCRRLRAGGL